MLDINTEGLMKEQAGSSTRVRTGFLFGIVLLFIAGCVEWEGWAGTRSQSRMDFATGGLLLVFWIGWTLYSQSGRDRSDVS